MGKSISHPRNKQTCSNNKEDISQTILDISQGVSNAFPTMASKSTKASPSNRTKLRPRRYTRVEANHAGFALA